MAAPLPTSLPDQDGRAPAELPFLRATGSAGDGSEGAELARALLEGFIVDWQLPERVGGPK